MVSYGFILTCHNFDLCNPMTGAVVDIDMHFVVIFYWLLCRSVSIEVQGGSVVEVEEMAV